MPVEVSLLIPVIILVVAMIDAHVKIKRRRALWAMLADKYGGELALQPSMWSIEPDHVSFMMREVQVRLEAYNMWQGLHGRRVQQTSASLSPDAQMSAQLLPRSGWRDKSERDSRFRRKHRDGTSRHGELTMLEDEALNAMFVVSTDEPTTLLRCLRGHEALKLHAHYPQLALSLQLDDLKMRALTSHPDEETIMAQVRLTALYAKAFEGQGQLPYMSFGARPCPKPQAW